MKYPKCEKTIIKNNYNYKGIEYINNIGLSCVYRIVKENKDTGVAVKYYKGKLLCEYNK